jgi:uncharacterized Zn-binding protein involved in type VI secretion
MASVTVDGLPVCASGAKNTGGGVPTATGVKLLINGLPSVVSGDAGICPGHSSPTPFTVTGVSQKILVDGKGVAYTGSMCSCGHTMVA